MAAHGGTIRLRDDANGAAFEIEIPDRGCMMRAQLRGPGPAWQHVYDLAIIGGGINGCGIARDAAGRGLSVFLCEMGDLASGTSSRSTKLIHGGLRYLEQYDFRLVREALTEREVLWRIAPHIVRPLRFVLPTGRACGRPGCCALGLFLYDHLGGRQRLPGHACSTWRADAAGAPLQARRIHHRLRILGLLGRRRAPRRSQRARCRRPRRRDPHAHACARGGARRRTGA